MIELLIVVAILAIISAVLIGVINPGRAISRSRDAVLKEKITGIASTVQNYNNIRGEWPSCANRADFKNFLDTTAFVWDGSLCGLNGYIKLTNPSIYTNGVAGGNLLYYPPNGSNSACVVARSNEFPSTSSTPKFIRWQPTTGVQVSSSSCP